MSFRRARSTYLKAGRRGPDGGLSRDAGADQYAGPYRFSDSNVSAIRAR
jgi:hypothetical protein